MELEHQILIHLLQKETLRVEIPALQSSLAQLVEMKSVQALKQIKAILDDNSLSDPDCFLKIEEIIGVFEDLGSGGERHDFG